MSNLKVSISELQELADKVRSEKSAVLPPLYDRNKGKVIMSDIERESLNVNQYNSTSINHEGIMINAKIDPEAATSKRLDLVLVTLETDVTFDARGKKGLVYKAGMPSFRLYSAA